jgi:hypothetical protein
MKYTPEITIKLIEDYRSGVKISTLSENLVVADQKHHCQIKFARGLSEKALPQQNRRSPSFKRRATPTNLRAHGRISRTHGKSFKVQQNRLKENYLPFDIKKPEEVNLFWLCFLVTLNLTLNRTNLYRSKRVWYN